MARARQRPTLPALTAARARARRRPTPGHIFRSRRDLAAESKTPGSYSLAGASAPTLAQPGYYVPTAGASSETPDDPGYYTPYAGATAEILALPPVISGTEAGQSTASGQPDTPFGFRHDYRSEHRHYRQSFDPADGRRRRAGRRRRFQRAHDERAWLLHPVGELRLRSPVNSTPLFLLRARAPGRRHLL